MLAARTQKEIISIGDSNADRRHGFSNVRRHASANSFAHFAATYIHVGWGRNPKAHPAGDNVENGQRQVTLRNDHPFPNFSSSVLT